MATVFTSIAGHPLAFHFLGIETFDQLSITSREIEHATFLYGGLNICPTNASTLLIMLVFYGVKLYVRVDLYSSYAKCKLKARLRPYPHRIQHSLCLPQQESQYPFSVFVVYPVVCVVLINYKGYYLHQCCYLVFILFTLRVILL